MNKNKMNKMILSILLVLTSSLSYAKNPVLGNVSFDKTGKKFIRIDVLDFERVDGSTEPFIKIHSCTITNKTQYSCIEINPLKKINGYELSKILDDRFLGYPQPRFLDYQTFRYTTRYGIGGAAIGSTGILLGYLVIATVPIGAAVGAAIGGIRDIYEYFDRDSLIKDIASGVYKIDDIQGLESEIERSLRDLY